MTVLFVRVAFRDGAPEVSARNKSFAALAGTPGMDESAPSTQIHPSLAPREGELLVTKRRVSAFSGSDLDVVLRAKNIDSLVLCGIATSGVVLSTFAKRPISTTRSRCSVTRVSTRTTKCTEFSRRRSSCVRRTC